MAEKEYEEIGKEWNEERLKRLGKCITDFEEVLKFKNILKLKN